MVTLSVCMIVKNEEDVLGRCLDSAACIADELIVVDTGSDDTTKAVAEAHGAKVFDYPWDEDFAAARNFSFAQATCDYVMWLDADDVLEDEEGMRALKRTLSPSVDVVMLPYFTAFDEWGKPSFSYYRERILRRKAGFQWEGAVHEVIAPKGNILYGEAGVFHRKTRPSDPDRNLRIFERMRAGGKELDPRQQFYYARELYYHQRYEEAAREFDAYLLSGKGWVENVIEACRHLSFCYYGMEEEEKALRSLLRSLEYDTPRAEVCCDIGKHFFDRRQVDQAVFWYRLALTRERRDRSGGFVLPDCYDYIPSLQLCVCYDRLGDLEQAWRYNEQAAASKPGDAAALFNRSYLLERRRAAEESLSLS